MVHLGNLKSYFWPNCLNSRGNNDSVVDFLKWIFALPRKGFVLIIEAEVISLNLTVLKQRSFL